MIWGCFLDPDPGIFLLQRVVTELSLEFAFRLELFSQSRCTDLVSATRPQTHWISEASCVSYSRSPRTCVAKSRIKPVWHVLLRTSLQCSKEQHSSLTTNWCVAVCCPLSHHSCWTPPLGRLLNFYNTHKILMSFAKWIKSPYSFHAVYHGFWKLMSLEQ